MATHWLRTWRTELRRTFSGTDAPPRWTQELADGGDVGYFAPGSAVWTVHGSMSPIVAGIRALLVQSLHPGAMAGVHDFSAYRQDPLKRLAGTIRWIFTVTYGDTAAARHASEAVQGLHRKVAGSYTDHTGAVRPYSANDPELARWVHLAFTDAFLRAHQVYGGRIPGGADRYVAEWATAAELMHVPDPPRSEAELRRQLASFDPVLVRSPQVEEALRLIRHPPLPASQRLGYRILFAGAVATLEPKYRGLLGLTAPHLGPVPLPVRLPVRLVLGLVHLGLGRRGPSEISARARIARLNVTPLPPNPDPNLPPKSPRGPEITPHSG